MAGYIKKIAVIKGIKKGFSADGGELSGLVKCEVYAGFLKAEISLINFAPLSGGRYVYGISDGTNIITFESGVFEDEAQFDLSHGFACLICFCNGDVFPVACAVCGDKGTALSAIKCAVEKSESAQKIDGNKYDDEAIAEVNYYEYKVDEGGYAVCEDKEKEKGRGTGEENENDSRPVEENGDGERKAGYIKSCDKTNSEKPATREQIKCEKEDKGVSDLAGGCFYERRKKEIESVLKNYPKEESLERVIESSRWVKIPCGEGAFYTFGVIYDGGNAAYICYGVPSDNADVPPDSLKGRSTFVPTENGGFWVMYQDARTGVSIKIEGV